jgi:trans-aconitate methyltransferase
VVSFDVSADAYGRSMGRYSEPLAALFVDEAQLQAGQRARDVGCGPGGTVPHRTVQEWWQPSTLGVGPAGAHVARLDDAGRAARRARCEQLLPAAPFGVVATAWCVRARV